MNKGQVRWSVVRWLSGGLLLIGLAWQGVVAAPLEAMIEGGRFRWVSAHTSFDGVAPTIWETPTKLAPAQAFIPGGSTQSEYSMQLIGPTGKTVSVPVELAMKGMEFSSPESQSASAVTGGGRARVSVAGGVVQLRGTGLGDSMVTLSREVSPFTHARPVFVIRNEAALLQAFANGREPQGTYAGQVMVAASYDYERRGVRIRRDWSFPLQLTIKHVPSVLTAVTLTSATNGLMTPRYYAQGSQTWVRGETTFTGAATGVFTQGLQLRLKQSDRYQMKAVTLSADGPQGEIPLSVECATCGTKALVTKGVPASGLVTRGTEIAGANVTSIPLSIRVSFTDVALDTLQLGMYQGQFSLVFEPKM